MIYVYKPQSQRPTLLPFIPGLSMWQYLRDYVAPAANLTVRDGTVYEWIVHDYNLDSPCSLPVFTRTIKHMKLGDVVPDGSKLHVTTGRPEPMYGNACFGDFIYVPVDRHASSWKVFDRALSCTIACLLLMWRVSQLAHVVKELSDQIYPWNVYVNCFMVVALYCLIRWVVGMIFK